MAGATVTEGTRASAREMLAARRTARAKGESESGHERRKRKSEI
jgi:hypothetical protein